MRLAWLAMTASACAAAAVRAPVSPVSIARALEPADVGLPDEPEPDPLPAPPPIVTPVADAPPPPFTRHVTCPIDRGGCVYTEDMLGDAVTTTYACHGVEVGRWHRVPHARFAYGAIAVVATDGLDRAIVRRGLAPLGPVLRQCVERNETFADLDLRGVINADGTIGAIEIVGATARDQRCLRDVLTAIEFPRGRDRLVTRYAWPLHYLDGAALRCP